MKVHKITTQSSTYTWCDRPYIMAGSITATRNSLAVTCLRCLGKIGDAARSKS